jgi:exonuclease VII small subunit
MVKFKESKWGKHEKELVELLKQQQPPLIEPGTLELDDILHQLDNCIKYYKHSPSETQEKEKNVAKEQQDEDEVENNGENKEKTKTFWMLERRKYSIILFKHLKSKNEDSTAVTPKYRDLYRYGRLLVKLENIVGTAIYPSVILYFLKFGF